MRVLPSFLLEIHCEFNLHMNKHRKHKYNNKRAKEDNQSIL